MSFTKDKEDAQAYKENKILGQKWFCVSSILWGLVHILCVLYNGTITREKLVTRDGTSLKKWLRKKGITRLGQVNSKIRYAGTFIAH